MTFRSAADVALVTSDLKAGGAQRVLVLLANHWAAQGRRVVVVTQAGLEEDFFQLDSKVRRIVSGGIGASPDPVRRVLRNLRGVALLRRALIEAGAPVAVAFVGRTAVRAVLAGLGLKLRLVAAERNDPGRQNLGPPWDLLRRLLYRRAHLVLANSQAGVAALAHFVPAGKLAFAPNPPPTPPAGAAAAKRGRCFLAVGRLHYQKAYDVLLDAFAIVAPRFPEWRLVVLGDGELRAELAGRAQALGLADRIDWLGRQADPWPWFRAADVFVLPSRFEGTPNALLEAMSCAAPPIVSDATAGALEYVSDGESGLVAPVNDAGALAAAMARLAADPALRARLGQAARLRVATPSFAEAVATWERLLGLA
jgi:glycosyltransferase involved in cell wall biosynthesis